MLRSRWYRFALPLPLACLLAGCGPVPSHSSFSLRHAGPATVTVSLHLTPGPALAAVDFINSRAGWVAGQRAILGTRNGGLSWQTLYRGPENLTGIRFVTGAAGWAWSVHTLLHTGNGGRTWTVVSRSASGFDSLSWISPLQGFAVVGNRYRQATRLEATTDGGSTWSTIPTPVPPQSVSFVDPLHGWIGGPPGWSVYRTGNGGKTWFRSLQLESTADTPWMGGTRVTGIGLHHAWALLVGGSGMNQTSYSVYRTDGHNTWTPVVARSTAGVGPAPGNPTGVPRGPGLSPGSLAVVNGSTAYLVGVCDACGWGFGTTTVQATGNGGASWTTNPLVFGANGYPGFDSLSFPTAHSGWLVDSGYGGPGQILVTHNGGSAWSEQYPTRGLFPLRGVSFVSPRTGYGLGAIDRPNAVLRTTDGGRHWKIVGSLPGSIPSIVSLDNPAIAFVNPQKGWAVSADGHLWSTTDGGILWKSAGPHGIPPYGSGIAFTAPTRGCVGAGGAFSWRTADGGQTWKRVQGTLAQCLADILPSTLRSSLHLKSGGAQQLPLWIGTAGGQVAWVTLPSGWQFTADGGRTWSHFRFPTGPYWVEVGWNPASLDFVNSHDGWIQTASGLLLATSDGGRQWIQLP